MEIDAREYRNAMGNFCTGIVVVTGLSEGEPVGFAAQSFVSLSLDPPLIAICPGKGSSTWPKLRESGSFCINMLAADQKPVCDTMAQSGIDKFAEVEWTAAGSGAPIIAGVMGFVDCALHSEPDAGDHTIAIGAVSSFEILRPDADPLLFFRGGYGQFEGLA